MQTFTLIGLTGLAGTGKDTVRGILESDFGATGLAFADPIRRMLSSLLIEADVPSRYMIDRQLKEEPIPGIDLSYRHLAQTLGTEWGRALLADDFWVRMAALRVARLRHNGARLVVLSDLRFPNEAHWVRTMGGHIWRVTRPQAQAVRDHASEQMVQQISAHRQIDNSGTVEALWCQVSAAMDELSSASLAGLRA